jgi:hypothetical protein
MRSAIRITYEERWKFQQNSDRVKIDGENGITASRAVKRDFRA